MNWELLSQPYTLTLILVCILPIVAGLAALKRRRQIVYAGISGSGLDRPPVRAAASMEAAILAVAGLGVMGLLFTGDVREILEYPKGILPQRVVLFWGLLMLAVVLLIGSVVVAWWGRTRLGLLVMLGTVSAYGLHVDAHKRFYVGRPIRILEPPGDLVFTIRLKDAHQGGREIIGADFWVGDVYLGKTPITIAKQTFWEKVGTVAKPDGFDDEANFSEAIVPNKGFVEDGFWRHTYPDPIHPYYRKVKTRTGVRFGAPEHSPEHPFRHRAIPVYGRAEVDGEPVRMIDQVFTQRIFAGLREPDVGIDVVLPVRETKIETVIADLRRADYQLNDAMLEELLALGMLGESRLDLLQHVEPQLGDVLETVIAEKLRRRFGYEPDLGVDRARECFERLLSDFASVADHVTEDHGQLLVRLAPQLDPDWLIAQILPYIRSEDFVHRHLSDSLKENRRGRLLHAAIVLDQHLNEAFPDRANPIETRLVTEILRWHVPYLPQHRGHNDGMNYARRFGGPVYEDYLFKHSDRKPDTLQGQLFVPGPRGRELRETHATFFWGLLAQQLKHYHEPHDILFADRPCGPESTARRFWHAHYKREIRNRYRLEMPYAWLRYLVRMEPDTPVRLYSQTYREILSHLDASNFNNLIIGLKWILTLEPSKQREILLELYQLTEANEDKFVFTRSPDIGQAPAETILTQLDEWLGWLGDEDAIERLLNRPDIPASDWYDRMHYYPPPRALLKAMVEHHDAAIRELADPVMAKYPLDYVRAIAR